MASVGASVVVAAGALVGSASPAIEDAVALLPGMKEASGLRKGCTVGSAESGAEPDPTVP